MLVWLWSILEPERPAVEWKFLLPMEMFTDLFFDYRCDRCGAPFCERVHIMNLTLDRVEEELCLACLAGEYGKTEPEIADFTWEYVQQRDCFKTPWENFDATACPRREDNTCYCQKTTCPAGSPAV